MRKQPEITTKTRKKIIDTFWELYRNFRIEKISIGMLMKQSGMNRSTFYEYFTDIYDLLDQAEKELLDSIEQHLDEYFANKNIISLNEFTREFADIFSMYDNKVFLLLSSKGDSDFSKKLKERIRKHITAFVDMNPDSFEFEYILTFIISSLGCILSHWYEDGKQENPEQILELMHTLIATGVFGLTESKSEIIVNLTQG